MRSWFLIAALLAGFWVMAVSVSPRIGATSDEQVHLVGGYSYWKYNDYRLQPENGNLTMRLEALPLLPMPLRFPDPGSAHFHAARANDVGHEFLFAVGNPFDSMLQRSRAMAALFGVATLWLVWRWARHLFGPVAGWVALAVGAFCPTLLAHSGLATSDAAITACLLAAVTACWRLLHRVTWPRLLVASLAVSAALLAKFSAVILLPLAALLLLARWARPVPLVVALGPRARWVRARGRIAGITLGLAGVALVFAFVSIWAGYGFRYSAFSPALTTGPTRPQLDWPDALGTRSATGPDGVQRAVEWARASGVLPEAYLFGFAFSYRYSRHRFAFLMGETSTTGWRKFFPLAFLLKTPPPQLLLFAAGGLALVLGARRRTTGARHWPRRGWLYRSTPLLALFCLYWAVAIKTPLNIGHRHLLPVYPVIYVMAGAAAGWVLLAGRRWLPVTLIAGAVVLQAVESWTARPFYLAYFTPWVGGTAQGWRYLVDSSLDWGQGLPDLEQWLAEKNARHDREPVFLTYFGTDSPAARKLPVTRFGDLVDDLEPRSFPAQVRGGWFLISATYFQGVYLNLSGPWTPRHETSYQSVLRRLAVAPPNIGALPAAERQPWAQAAQDYERLQYGRLRHFLRDRKPQTLIGASLLVFHLTDQEVQRALYGPPAP